MYWQQNRQERLFLLLSVLFFFVLCPIFFRNSPFFLSLKHRLWTLMFSRFFCTKNIDSSFFHTFYLTKNIRSFLLFIGSPFGEKAEKVQFLRIPTGFFSPFCGFASKNVLPAILPYSEKINRKTAFLFSTIFPYLMNCFSLLMV